MLPLTRIDFVSVEGGREIENNTDRPTVTFDVGDHKLSPDIIGYSSGDVDSEQVQQRIVVDDGENKTLDSAS